MKNKRLKEIKFAIELNHIDKAETKEKYQNLLNVLSSLAFAFGPETSKAFAKAVEGSICDGFMGASNKELVACSKKYFTTREFSSKLGISTTAMYSRYSDILKRDFEDEEFNNSLQHKLDSKDEVLMISYLDAFIDRFKLPKDTRVPAGLNEERTLEIDFYIIYNKLFNIFRNDGFISKFIENLCASCNLDYTSIMNLKNNIHIINRSFPNFRYNASYFRQEIVTLFLRRGYKKGSIGTKVFEKEANYLYNKGAKLFNKPINEEDLFWQYSHTIDWKNTDIKSVRKFIDILHEFSDYDV